MQKTTTMTTPEINIPITSKYKEIIEAVRDNVRDGMEHNEAVETALNEFWYKFTLGNEGDREILLLWLSNKLAA